MARSLGFSSVWLLLGLLPACKSAESGAAPPGASAPSSEPPRSASSAPFAHSHAPPAPAQPPASTTAAPPLAAKPRREAYRIAALGDSLTDEKSFGGGYLDYVQERCPKTRIDNFAKGGFMLNQIRRRFENEVHNQPKDTYTHVIVWGGVNDLYSDLTAGRTPEKAELDLRTIYEKAHNKGAQVVAITVSPWGGFKRYYNDRRQGYTLALNDWIREQGRAGKADAVIDAYGLLSCGQPELLCPEYQQRSPDGLHLGKQGHQVLGKALFDAVFQNCL